MCYAAAARRPQTRQLRRENEDDQQPVLPAEMPRVIQDEQEERCDTERSQAERCKSKTRNNTLQCHAGTRDRDSLRSWALIAQMTVLADMNTAPSAGVRITPHGKNKPAAAGMANVL